MHLYKTMLIKWSKPFRKNPKLVWGSFFAIGTVVYLKVWIPLTGLSIPCPIHAVTGLYCPGCGMTRSLTALLKLDLEAAFRYNSLVYALVPLYLCYWLLQRKKLHRTSNAVLIAMVILALGYGIARNLPLFDRLAPPDL
ncbi:DUF2752 domain-containing protein [Paenibacillus camelliae]|uniref:DUF2752 domain-containing protein n=2 Tax=Paenibacillus TaxID=44249 RepID=UPI00203FD82D|nr:DUF2752 domain-containing protein [Paenibacillus camelliae]